MTELKCERCEYEGMPLVVGQHVKCTNCGVKFSWVVAGKYMSDWRKRKDEIRREEYNKKTKRDYRL